MVESCKTLDNKTFFKTGNVCQVRGGGRGGERRGGEVVGGEGRGGEMVGGVWRGGDVSGGEERGGDESGGRRGVCEFTQPVSCLCWCADAGVFGGGE